VARRAASTIGPRRCAEARLSRDRAIDGAGAEALRPQGGRSTFGGGTEGFTIQL
jgi:hypothetical protein